METLQERIGKDLKKAMIAKDEKRRDFLRLMIGEFNRTAKKELSDEEVIKVLDHLRENARMLGNQSEINMVSEYAPEKFDESRVKVILESIVSEEDITSIKEIGRIMKAVRSRPDAMLIDNALVSKLAKEMLR